ncbi:hypothetical protein ScPMuIL_010119 [Solemya velum]
MLTEDVPVRFVIFLEIAVDKGPNYQRNHSPGPERRDGYLQGSVKRSRWYDPDYNIGWIGDMCCSRGPSDVCSDQMEGTG